MRSGFADAQYCTASPEVIGRERRFVF